MVKDLGVIVVVAVISALLAMMFGYGEGLREGQEKMRLEAVEKGHARFIADSKGKVIFCWHDRLCSFTTPQEPKP